MPAAGGMGARPVGIAVVGDFAIDVKQVLDGKRKAQSQPVLRRADGCEAGDKCEYRRVS